MKTNGSGEAMRVLCGANRYARVAVVWMAGLMSCCAMSHAQAGALTCSVEPTRPQLGQAVHWQLHAIDLRQTLPTWTAADFGADWSLHAQSSTSSADGKGHSDQLGDITLYPMRSGALALPPLQLGSLRCGAQAVTVVTHASGETPLYWATHIQPAHPMEGELVRIELDVGSAGGLSWEPITLEATDASVRPLATLSATAWSDDARVPIERNAWAVLPLRPGPLQVRVPRIEAMRFGQLLVYPPQSLELQVRPRPSYWPVDLPVGRPRVFDLQAPHRLRIGQAGVLRCQIQAPGLTADVIARILQAQNSPHGLIFQAPHVSLANRQANQVEVGLWRVEWPFRATSGGAVPYPVLRIPYLEPTIAAPKLVQASWGQVRVEDLRAEHAALGVLGAAALVSILFLLRGCWLCCRRWMRLMAWRRIMHGKDADLLLRHWTRLRQQSECIGQASLTLRQWAKEHAAATPSEKVEDMRRLIAHVEAQRYGPNLNARA